MGLHPTWSTLTWSTLTTSTILTKYLTLSTLQLTLSHGLLSFCLHLVYYLFKTKRTFIHFHTVFGTIGIMVDIIVDMPS